MRLSPEQEAATAIDDNLIVNAGAGSGKTTVLTTRYIRLLKETGLSPGEIVAITFTRKAAREMRERIDKKLADFAQGRQLQEARDQLVSAPISTIHSFYSRILRAYPVEAGVDPGFRVLDELETDLLLTQAISKVIQDSYEAQSPDLTIMIEVLGAQALEEEGGLARDLKSIYKTLLNRGIPLDQVGLSLYHELEPWEQYRDDLLDITADEADVAASISRDSEDKAKARRMLVQGANLLASVTSPQDILAIQDKLLPLTKLKGGNTKGHGTFVNGAAKAIKGILSQGLAPLLGQAMINLLRDLDSAFSRAKAQAGGLDYSDLQFAVWKLLRENPHVVSQLKTKYKTYMVDEFQDTDRLQYQIIKTLVEEDGQIPPGRLFVVGDEKQSIYRFRGAEVRVFDEVRQQLTRDNPGREKKITCNYRSQGPLIDMVNAMFSTLMDKDQGGEINYIPLSAHRQATGPCVEIITCEASDDESKSEAEAQALSARVREMVDEGQELVGQDEGVRPVGYGDIAILVRSRTHLREYEHQLRIAGIPYTVVGGIGFYQQPEVMDIVNLLRLVNNLRDELALTAVLRSPMAAISDDNILVLFEEKKKLGGSLLDHGSTLAGQDQERFQGIKEIIIKLRQVQGRLELPKLIELALDLTSFRQIALSRFGGMQRYANIEKLLELAQNFQRGSLAEFLAWLEHASGQNEAEAQIDSEASDSVKIMTIHASKGLEFPVVFLPICSSTYKHLPGNILVDSKGQLAFKRAWDCPVWNQAKEEDKFRELEEYKRLLYVAMTRARDWLSALVVVPGKKETSFNMWLQEFAKENPGLIRHAQPKPATQNIFVPQALPEAQPQVELSWQPEQTFPGLAPVGHGKRTFRYFSISQFMLWKQDPQEFHRRYLSRWVENDPLQNRAQREVEWQHEPGGPEFGSLLHEALELLEPSSDINSLLTSLVDKYFPGTELEQTERIFYSARTLLNRFQDQPGPKGDFASRENELEFYYRLNDNLFYGLIDQVLVANDHVVVLDYKTNKIPKEGIGPLLDAYGPQLKFYALAAAEIYKRPAKAYLQLLRQPSGEQLVEIPTSQQDFNSLKQELQEFIEFCHS